MDIIKNTVSLVVSWYSYWFAAEWEFTDLQHHHIKTENLTDMNECSSVDSALS